MKRRTIAVVSILWYGLTLSAPLLGGWGEEIEKAYENKKELRIKFVLGDCELKKSTDDKIHVHLVYTYDEGKFEPKFRERGSVLTLREKFYGDNPNGYSRWTISVPDGLEIDFESATGDFRVEGISGEMDGSSGTGNMELRKVGGEIDVSSGTGNVELMDSKGEFEASSGTGDVLVENSEGTFDVSSGTGDVEASGITIIDEGEFSSGTGDVMVTGPKGENFDLSVSSGTDDAVLRMGGLPIQGYFEFTSHARKGRITCPVAFDTEEEYWEGDELYYRKSFAKGNDTTRFYIKTGTGKAKLMR